MTNENNDDYQLNYVQLLGSTSTQGSLNALIAILSSALKPKHITAVFYPVTFDPNHHFEEVCFIAWSHIQGDFIIIPDGFGTHGGGGGSGFEKALELIKFYNIPLDEAEVENREQFKRIASGQLLESDIHFIQQAVHKFTMNTVINYTTERSKPLQIWKILNGENIATTFPYWIMEEELLSEITGFEDRPNNAVFLCAKRLEVMIRKASGASAELTGNSLVNNTMKSGGILEPIAPVPSEREAWANLFRGVFGAFRNPEGHRDQKIGHKEAFGQIMTINMLVRKLKTDYSEKLKT